MLEDNETARFVFRAVLEPAGYIIVDVIDETEALHICELADESFDLLIADVVLRAEYGTDTAKRIAKIRRSGSLRCVPICRSYLRAAIPSRH